MDLTKNKKILLACDVNIQKKVIEFALNQIDNISVVFVEDKIKGLAKVFTAKPDMLIIAYTNIDDTLYFISAVRNNKEFKNTPIVLVLHAGINIFQRIKIGSLGVKEAFFIPLDQRDFVKIVKRYL